MKKSIPILLIILILFSFCFPPWKMELYNKFKKEIVKNVFAEFEKHLPASFDSSIMWDIRNAPSYKALGCSGIDVLYNFKDSDFDKNIRELYSMNKVPKNLFYDSLNLNRSNSEYYSFSSKNLQKIAIPRVKDDFCRTNDTCFSWNDLDVVILETGKKRVFSKNVSSEYQPKDPICNYSIGALISKRKQQIIYWLFIYK
jgi:hypothetical protein